MRGKATIIYYAAEYSRIYYDYTLEGTVFYGGQGL